MRDRERERKAETQAEGEAGSTQRARRGTRFRVSRSHPGLQAALNRCATGAALLWVFSKELLYKLNSLVGNCLDTFARLKPNCLLMSFFF